MLVSSWYGASSMGTGRLYPLSSWLDFGPEQGKERGCHELEEP